MALSTKVEESLKEAEGCLRNALSYAARQERPMVCGGIAELLAKIETLQEMDQVFDKMEQGDIPNPFGPFFK